SIWGYKYTYIFNTNTYNQQIYSEIRFSFIYSPNFSSTSLYHLFNKTFSKCSTNLTIEFFEEGMESQPNEVIHMFLEHMTHKQRKAVARVSKIWNFLTNTFPQTPKFFNPSSIFQFLS